MSRKEKALEILRNGGYITYARELNWKTNAFQFQYRLKNKDGMRVKGIGFKTLMDLVDSGLATRDYHASDETYTVWNSVENAQ